MTPLLPNSPEGSPKGAINNDIASEIGSSTPLEEPILPVNPLLSVVQDPHLLRINSSRDIVIEEYIEMPIGPHEKSGVDAPFFQSEPFRTLVHVVGNFDPRTPGPSRTLWRTSSGQNIFYKLEMSHLRSRTPNQPMASQTPMTSTTYTIPLDHFTGTTNNVVTVSDQLLVGFHSILPLHLTRSTMVSQAMPISAGKMLITQAPIGTLLPLRKNPSLPPGYNSLNTSIAIPTHNPSGRSNLFVPPGYNDASHFVPTPTQVLSGGPYIPHPPSPGRSNHPSPSSSNQFGGTSHIITSGFQISVGGKLQVGGHNSFYGQNIPTLQY
jgi:hypothetical protein